LYFYRFVRFFIIICVILTLFITLDAVPISTASSASMPHGVMITTSNKKINPNQKLQYQSAPNIPADWPQVQNNPQRTGYSSEILGTTFQVMWTHPFQPERIFPQVQAIIYGGKVFVGTEMGNLYSLDALTGALVWKYSVRSPILNSVAAGNGKVFFGAMDGAVYALHTDGPDANRLAWRLQLSQRLGFSTAPVYVSENDQGSLVNKVLIGGRDGIFYALNADTGETIWQYSVGAPILQTAAYNNGRVYFGAMDMRVYALYTAKLPPTGQQRTAWRSVVLPGMAFKDYWPVVHQGMVYVRPMGVGGLGVNDPSKVTDLSAQKAVLDDYAVHPGNYTLNLIRFEETPNAIDKSNVSQAPPVIQYDFQTMNGATSPPCVDRDLYLVIPSPFPTQSYSTGWGRLDVNPTSPNYRTIVDVLNDGTGSGFGNRDENMNLTCTGNLIFAMHTQEENANYTGAFLLDSPRRWIHILPGETNRQMSNNTQGGGGNPASISHGWVYHISRDELIARKSQ
jgi:outer membrane protein assembly factor BamB